LGAELPTGTVPLPITAGQASTDARDISAGGLAYALDGGLRFARQWYAGLTLEHAALGGGSDPSKLGSGVSKEASDTTLLGIALGLIVNPDKTSFYGEIGLAERWYTVTDQTNSQHYGYNSGEVLLGVGLWIPAGRSFSLLPKATVGLGNFDTPNAPSGTSTSSQGHAFFMLGVAGLFNVDL
jgi:hypothetical protein